MKIEKTNEQQNILSDFKKYKDILVSKFSAIIEWNEGNIEKTIKDFVENNQVSFKSIAQPLRLSVTGSLFGPSLYKIIKILGKEKTITRIRDN